MNDKFSIVIPHLRETISSTNSYKRHGIAFINFTVQQASAAPPLKRPAGTESAEVFVDSGIEVGSNIIRKLHQFPSDELQNS